MDVEHLLIILAIPAGIWGFVNSPLWGWVTIPIRRWHHTRVAVRESLKAIGSCLVEQEEIKLRLKLMDTREKEWGGRVERLEQWVDRVEKTVDEIADHIAPTNGDKRSISDRLDTVKYQNAVNHSNHIALCTWLSNRFPEAEPITTFPLPNR